MKTEWTRTTLKSLSALVYHPQKSKRWAWCKVDRGGPAPKVCLVDAQGRLWEFKMRDGSWIRPAWKQEARATGGSSPSTAPTH